MTNKSTVKLTQSGGGSITMDILRDSFVELYNWLLMICPESNVDGYVHAHKYFEPESMIRVILYTNDYSYTISARKSNNTSYLGATVNCRKPRAGEDWTRGRDLPDGKYCEDTWDKILKAIIRYELKPLEI